MPRSIATVVLVLAVATSAAVAFGADNSRAEKALEASWRKLRNSPDRVDAELEVISIFKAWNTVGPDLVMQTLARIESLPKASVRVRERARHFLALGKLRLGDIEAATSEFAKRGFLFDWIVSGPFDNEGGTGFDTPFPAEQAVVGSVDLDAPMPGKDRDVRWRPAPEQIHFLGYNHMEALLEPSINACGYAVTSLESKKAGRGVLHIGAGGAFRGFWNGREVLNDTAYRRPDPDRFAAAVQIRKGLNRLLVKVCAEDNDSLGFYARVTDMSARAWPIAAVENQLAALKTSIKPGPVGRPIPQPLELIVNAAKKRKDDLALQLSAARYMFETGSIDRLSLLARDMARAVCLRRPSVSKCLVYADLALGRNERRLALEKAHEADPESVSTLLALARIEKDGSEPHLALSYIDKALALKADDLEALALKNEISAAYGFTLLAYENAHKLALAHPRVPRIIDLAADLAERSGRAADALSATRHKIEQRFDKLSAHEVLTRAALAENDTKTFERHIEALTRLAPFDRNNLAFTAKLLEGSGALERAESALRARIELAPFDAAAHKDLGLFLLRTNREVDGVTALSLSAAIRPQDAWLADYLAHLKPRPRFEEPFIVPPETFLADRGKRDDGEELRLLVDQTVVRVYDSGLSSRFRQIVGELKNREAARAWRLRSIQYSPSGQQLKVLAARVFRADGTVKSSIARGTMPVSEPWFRLYYDVSAEMVELPPLVPGDVVELQYRIDDTAHRNAFNDYFGDFVFIDDTVPKNMWRYTLISPKSRSFFFNKTGMGELRKSSETEGNISKQVFETHNLAAIRPEHGMPGITSAASYLHVSTYESWEDLGKWYQGLLRHQLIPDARIREKVRELTAGLKSDDQKARAIYEWVVTATRYVGLEFGIHGFKPYRVPLIVSRGFGDCKDKASLLVSMLGVAGIEAEFVLVRTRDLGSIEPFPASLSAFNHAIVHVPGLDLWIDGTAEHHGPFEFPFGDQDAPSLRIRKTEVLYSDTPVMPPTQNNSETTLDVLLDPDGDARIEVRSSVRGHRAAALRRNLEAVQTRRERFEASLATTFQGARLGELSFSSLMNLSAPVAYEFSAFIPGFARFTGDTLDIPVDIGLNLSSKYARLPTREHDLVVGPTFVSTRSVAIPIPTSHVIAEMPSAYVIENQFGSLSLEVHEKAGAIHISRRFELVVHEVSRKDYPLFVDFIRQVDDALAEKVRLRRSK